MNTYKISMFVYANSKEEETALERCLYEFVDSKRKEDIAVTAQRLLCALEKFKDNIFVTEFLKRR